jgi:eukaryotic-like serine/threonine-protein kinase
MSDALSPLVAAAQQRVGTTLRRGKYTLDGLLGVGAMGAVFSGTHRNGMRVAIKVLHKEIAKIESLRSRFLREGYIANRVQHPSLVRVIDDDEDDDGTTFLVMELLVGKTLAAAWLEAERQMPAPRVAAILDGLLDVLGAIHAEGIVHRDIKPDNVFLTDSGLKLLDLGIARLQSEASMTASGQMMGTPEYVSPEQAGGYVREIDARSDLYSVGAMAFTLLTGHVVHEARTPMEGMIFAATRPARSLFEVWPEAPAGLANVVDVALCFEKARRWESAEQMRTALANAMRVSMPKGVAGEAKPAPAAAAPVPPPAPIAGSAGPTVILGSDVPSQRRG